MKTQNLEIPDAYLSVAKVFFFSKFKNNHDMVAVNMEFVLECSFYSIADMIWGQGVIPYLCALFVSTRR